MRRVAAAKLRLSIAPSNLPGAEVCSYIVFSVRGGVIRSPHAPGDRTGIAVAHADLRETRKACLARQTSPAWAECWAIERCRVADWLGAGTAVVRRLGSHPEEWGEGCMHNPQSGRSAPESAPSARVRNRMFGWHGTVGGCLRPHPHDSARAPDRGERSETAQSADCCWRATQLCRAPPPWVAAPLYPLLRCATEESEAFSLDPGSSLRVPIRRRRACVCGAGSSAQCKHETARPRAPCQPPTSSVAPHLHLSCAPSHPRPFCSIPTYSDCSPTLPRPSPLLSPLLASRVLHPPRTCFSARATEPQPATTPQTAVSSLRSSSVRSGQFSAAVPVVFPLGPRCGGR